jgi:mono/diheme cytochrome c family protein
MMILRMIDEIWPWLLGGVLGACITAMAITMVEGPKESVQVEAPKGQEGAHAVARQTRGVFKQHCYRCHHGAGSEGGEFDVLKPSDLLSREVRDPSLVVPGKPGESYLCERVVKGQMPPRNIKERPTDAEKEIVRRWIESGAPAFPDDATRRPFQSLGSVLLSVRDRLRSADAADRRFLRFFTLHTLANNPAVADDDLRIARAALSKTINSLSRKPRIVVPAAVDPARTVFVFDLRELGWDRSTVWLDLERAYPYGLKYDALPDEILRRLDRELCDLTKCDLPVIRADWFVATATRPPLYHTLLQLPQDTTTLERELGVDISFNFLHPRPERIARAGFARSGVSGQNRMVARHGTPFGAIWISYDFKPANGRSKLARFPLGPMNLFPEGQHPFPNQAFVHDGGEIIFSLPNGLQGYLLVDGNNRRIDAGPINIVGDVLKTAGAPEIVAALSCMACHKHGMIPVEDAVRANNAVFGEAEEQVRQLYPEKAVMDRLFKQDADRFLAALEKTIGPFLREGSDKDKPIREFPEPIAELTRFYRLNDLDLKAVACELELEDPQVLVRQVGETQLKRLGLDGLLHGGGISRQEWEAIDGLSLMQELAKELRFTPLMVR